MNSYLLIGLKSLINHNDLEKHGISRYVQYKKLNTEQADWLASHFE